MIREILASVKSLLIGTVAVMLGNRLLGVILPLRMEAAGYPVALIGAIMAAYYLGLALGGLRGKHVIFRIAQLRAFAAFAALIGLALVPLAMTRLGKPDLGNSGTRGYDTPNYLQSGRWFLRII